MARPRPILRRCALALVLAASLGCGEPLDRLDGALVIRLNGVPDRVDRVVARLHAGGRTFEIDRARPAADVLADFTAVPAGEGRLEVELFEGSSLVAALRDLAVQIRADAVAEVNPSFTAGPELELEVRGTSPHRRWAGPVLVDVRDRTLTPSAEVELAVWANGAPQPVPPVRDGGWILQIDPALAGDLLPGPLEIRVEACFAGLPGACTPRAVSVEVDRRIWRLPLGARPVGAPLVLADRGWLVIGDEQGRLHVIDEASGERVQDALPVGAELSGAPARAQDIVAISDRAGSVHGLVIEAGGLRGIWSTALSAPRPSAVVSDRGRFVVGDQARLLALDPQTGDPSVLATMSAPIDAAPSATADGVAAADLGGGVIALDGQDAVRFERTLDAPIYAAPVPEGEHLWVVTSLGRLYALPLDGSPAAPPVDLGAPVVFAPIRVGSAWALAAARDLVFVDGEDVTSVPLGERIIGAPAAWPDGRRVVVGLFNGRVVVVDPAQGAKSLAGLTGLALSPRVLSEPARVAAATSTGEFQVIRAEEGF